RPCAGLRLFWVDERDAVTRERRGTDAKAEVVRTFLGRSEPGDVDFERARAHAFFAVRPLAPDTDEVAWHLVAHAVILIDEVAVSRRRADGHQLALDIPASAAVVRVPGRWRRRGR